MSKLAKALTAAAGNAGGDNLYVEDVFSNYLYDGTGASLPIVNGIDLDAEGGLVWTKSRTSAAEHKWYDSARGISYALESNTTDANQTEVTGITSFNSNGYTYGTDGNTNSNGTIYASWTFRKAEKFFDIVTYTGNSTAGRTVSHNLGVAPAWMVIKCTTAARNWCTYHISLGNGHQIILNNAAAKESTALWNYTTPTATEFTLGTDADVNGTGNTYVAYLFASDAGGFGDDDESIIKCGSVTTDGSGNASVDVGFEPQWCLWKCADAAGGNEHGNWRVNDVMRGWPVPDASNAFGYPSSLYANTSGAETISGVDGFIKSATGFGFGQVQANKTYIYIAIRRPMKTPEAGTEVFSPYGYQDATLTSGSGTASNRTILNGGVNGGTNFPVDLFMGVNRTGNHAYALHVFDRLRGKGESLLTNAGTAEPAGDGASNGGFDFQEGVDVEYNGQLYYYTTAAGNRTHIAYFLKRATGFFDVVAYTGNGTAGNTVAHNLGVAPEFMIVKPRGTGNWATYNKFNTATDLMYFNENYATDTNNSIWNNTTPTDTVFTLGSGFTNTSNGTFIAYLFATLAGVSKVGSYTGTGSDLNVDCGFSAGARFILIKRTDSTGDWYYWDSARGIVAGNDPYQLTNSNAAEVTNTDYVDPLNAGFTVTSSASSTVNVSSGTYIFLAIA